MTKRLEKLSHRIVLELRDVEQAVKRVQVAWQEYDSSGNDLYLDSVALNLHSVYNGLERLFQGIATTLDNQLPSGDGWHKALLEQMASDVPEVRPAVISDTTFVSLDNYCRFRHVVRNVYSYRLDPEQIKPLVENVGETFSQTQQELLALADWLKQF